MYRNIFLFYSVECCKILVRWHHLASLPHSPHSPIKNSIFFSVLIRVEQSAEWKSILLRLTVWTALLPSQCAVYVCICTIQRRCLFHFFIQTRLRSTQILDKLNHFCLDCATITKKYQKEVSEKPKAYRQTSLICLLVIQDFELSCQTRR